jgi:hypothetical protein
MGRTFSICWALCSALVVLSAYGAEGWVAPYIEPGDKLLCEAQQHGDRFFVVLHGDKLRLGYKLDMSQFKGTNSFVAGWSLRDENDRVAIAQIVPISIKDEYKIEDGKPFATGVQEQTLRGDVAGKIGATLNVKKCPSSECERTKTLSPAEVSYSVAVCSATIAR